MQNTAQIIEFEDFGSNPLDTVEDVLHAHDWVFNRVSNKELVVKVSGALCEYRLFFIWQADMQVLQFCCQFDTGIDVEHHNRVAEILMRLNENLWMGHFDLPEDTGIPSFRYAALFKGVQDGGYEIIEDMIDMSMTQCERFFPVFSVLCSNHDMPKADLDLVLMDAAGQS